MMSKTAITFTIVLLLAPVLQGCAPAVVGGAAVGASMVHDRRTAGVAVEDQDIEFKALHMKLQDEALRDHTTVSATSYNMVVLLTGQAETAELRDRYSDMVSRIARVRRVVNEITVGPTASLAARSNDSYLTSRVKVRLFDVKIPDFDPTRVKVVTEQGVVYLMGLLTQQEADAVVEKVRYVRGVKRVVKIFEYIDNAG